MNKALRSIVKNAFKQIKSLKNLSITFYTYPSPFPPLSYPQLPKLSFLPFLNASDVFLQHPLLHLLATFISFFL